MGIKCYLGIVLIHISLMTNEIKCLFVPLLAILCSSLIEFRFYAWPIFLLDLFLLWLCKNQYIDYMLQINTCALSVSQICFPHL